MSENISETQSDAAPVVETAQTAELAVSEAAAVVLVAEPEVLATPIPRHTVNLAELDSRYHQLPRSILEVP